MIEKCKIQIGAMLLDAEIDVQCKMPEGRYSNFLKEMREYVETCPTWISLTGEAMDGIVSEQQRKLYEASSQYILRIIPDDSVKAGYKRIVGFDVLVNPHNYKLLKPLTAKQTLHVLGRLPDMVD